MNESICLNLKVRRWKEGAGRVRISFFSLWSLVRSPDEITSSCNITNLTQHQLIVLFSSFLLLSCHLLESSVTFSSSAALGMHSQWIQPQVLHVAAIFYSPACFFLSTVFSPCVLCCWWATAKTLIPNTVCVRVHTRGAFTHPHPSDPLAKRKIFPWAMALSSFCACVWACEWERRGETAVMANTQHRYWSKVRSFGKKMTASSSHLIRVTARILGCLKVPQTPKILKITSLIKDPFSFCHAQTEW